MGSRRLDTLGDVARQGLLVLFKCPCGHEARYAPRDIIGMIGSSGRDVTGLKGICRACGRRGVRASIDPDSVTERPIAPAFAALLGRKTDRS
ncbi:hypothetical protein SAE02_61760 [Skermanella aerolata]|uniref:Uncharacterized protein n=1 Tax=Skermanella aerolata TaxID=393310 RepID=A0A512DZW1_9PROT|nr:hypothetical protein [Skermanella aerolata]KJB91865.1 hypothetical protein N826_25450 [Skermanella aerolata KACC 11604]GEO42028.1 hypothetical protein SAE02_61760 [Skermanella aerolata]